MHMVENEEGGCGSEWEVVRRVEYVSPLHLLLA